jgi:hypothetical protein
VRRSIRLAAVSLAALAALPNDAFADPRARESWWALSVERPRVEERTEALAKLAPAAAFSELGWVRPSDLKPGAGLQLDLAAGLALCADWERYRPKGVQARETVDTLLLGLQVTFP